MKIYLTALFALVLAGCHSFAPVPPAHINAGLPKVVKIGGELNIDFGYVVVPYSNLENIKVDYDLQLGGWYVGGVVKSSRDFMGCNIDLTQFNYKEDAQREYSRLISELASS